MFATIALTAALVATGAPAQEWHRCEGVHHSDAVFSAEEWPDDGYAWGCIWCGPNGDGTGNKGGGKGGLGNGQIDWDNCWVHGNAPKPKPYEPPPAPEPISPASINIAPMAAPIVEEEVSGPDAPMEASKPDPEQAASPEPAPGAPEGARESDIKPATEEPEALPEPDPEPEPDEVEEEEECSNYSSEEPALQEAATASSASPDSSSEETDVREGI